MLDMLYCPKCHATGDSIGECGNFTIPCPEPIPVDVTKVAVLTCGPCRRTMAIPVGAIMQGHVRSSGRCVSSECAATLVVERGEVVPPLPSLSAAPPPPKAKAPKAPKAPR